MPIDIPPDQAKAAMKEALKEWLDEQFATFGKWSAGGILALLFGGLFYLAMMGMGWHR